MFVCVSEKETAGMYGGQTQWATIMIQLKWRSSHNFAGEAATDTESWEMYHLHNGNYMLKYEMSHK